MPARDVKTMIDRVAEVFVNRADSVRQEMFGPDRLSVMGQRTRDSWTGDLGGGDDEETSSSRDRGRGEFRAELTVAIQQPRAYPVVHPPC